MEFKFNFLENWQKQKCRKRDKKFFLISREIYDTWVGLIEEWPQHFER